MNEQPGITRVWQLYQSGVNYNNRLENNYYEDVDTCWQFFMGNHWMGFTTDDDEDLPKPVLNFIRHFITFYVASLTTSNLKIHLSPYLQSESVNMDGMTNQQITEMVNSHIDFLLEKFKMEYKLRDGSTDAAITGDSAIHFYFDPTIKPYGAESGDHEGEIVSELIDGVNIIFGNPNIFETEPQPYILVLGRDTIDSLRREAIENGNESEAGLIMPDNEHQLHGTTAQIENDDIEEYQKALFIYCYRRDPETGTILVSKSTQSAMIFDEVDTELTKYPVAWLNWQKRKGTYHGISVASALIDTNIFINQMVSMIMLHLTSSAFPKIVYDIDAFPDGIDNRVGRSIGVSNLSDKRVQDLIDTIQPSSMSSDIIRALETIVQYFKESAGISNASLGIAPNSNTSGKALIAMQESAAVPLGTVASNLNEWMESIGEIIVDMMSVYYETRPLVLKQEDGTRQLKEFDFTQLKNIWLNVACDVSQSTKFSEVAQLETMSNLLNGGFVDFVQFLERIPEGYMKNKQGLIDEIKEKIQQPPPNPAPAAPNTAPPPEMMPQQPNVDAILSQLSPEEQQMFMSQPPEIQQQLLAQIIG